MVKHLRKCSVRCRHDFWGNWATASLQFHIPLLLQVKNQVQVQTFASSTFSSFLDVLLSCFVFLALTLACFLPPLVSPSTAGPPAPAALALAPLAGLLELASLVLSIRWGGRWHADDVCVCRCAFVCWSAHMFSIKQGFDQYVFFKAN